MKHLRFYFLGFVLLCSFSIQAQKSNFEPYIYMIAGFYEDVDTDAETQAKLKNYLTQVIEKEHLTEEEIALHYWLQRDDDNGTTYHLSGLPFVREDGISGYSSFYFQNDKMACETYSYDLSTSNIMEADFSETELGVLFQKINRNKPSYSLDKLYLYEYAVTSAGNMWIFYATDLENTDEPIISVFFFDEKFNFLDVIQKVH